MQFYLFENANFVVKYKFYMKMRISSLWKNADFLENANLSEKCDFLAICESCEKMRIFGKFRNFRINAIFLEDYEFLDKLRFFRLTPNFFENCEFFLG